MDCRIKGLSARAWLVVGLLALQAGLVGQAHAEPAADEHELGVTRTVVGILGYTRWPTESPVLRLCVVGSTEYADDLLNGAPQTVGSQRLEVRRVVPVDARALVECEGIYAGQLDEAAWRKLMEQLAGRPLLTISERGELCRIGAMFCLRRRGEGAGFEVSLDSVARSGLRVNPKVLQLARHRTLP
ncbi:hypothetical protein BO996_15725 [Delftia sp. HK171]|jgi:hypothetical protein|uniref:YfiR family protein n=1 Tax=Delftia acidovorans TaxID=80866 RepID=A0AAJ2R5G1_DELAC|nr:MULTISPECIES: YfiR family protein [Delftia]PIF37964.1 uncharacterized protein DUF4154 [Burkholderiales bacterium 23]AEF90334.1 hypothetical protein DelCs14_3339 [Delftia sp. Cs1-4]APE49185.1 hypothetical protein BO996_15725 [Delftia sp. HK171]KZK27866.1 hypothetical protein A4F85_08455 [Delftia sp. GW456-R20]MBD9583073.1 YfiR family protein [Delftia sp. DLF01]